MRIPKGPKTAVYKEMSLECHDLNAISCVFKSYMCIVRSFSMYPFKGTLQNNF